MAVHLQSNMLTGELPLEWAETTRWNNLTVLDLHENVLSGTIPPNWGANGTLPALTDL